MACLFAARFKEAGRIVTILDSWDDGLTAIHDSGITISNENSIQTFSPFHTLKDTLLLKENTYLALILVKSWQTSWAAKQIKSHLLEDGIALTLQNGLGNYELLTQELGADHTAIGVTTMGATLLSPGNIRSHENGEIILSDTSHSLDIISQFEGTGFRVKIEKNIDQVLWGKLIVNIAVNPLSALLKAPNGVLLSNPYSNQLIHTLINEALQVAKSLHISLSYENPLQHVEDILQATAGNYTSMYQDIRRGAETEIEALNGAIIRLGEKNGIPTPVNNTIYHLIKAHLENRKNGD